MKQYESVVIEQIVRFFYGAKIAFSLWFISLYSHTSFQAGQHALWPVRWLASLDHSKQIIFTLAVLLLLTQLLSIMNPLKSKIKYTEAFFSFFYFAALFSTQNLGHSFYGFILTSFFIASLSQVDCGSFSNEDLGRGLKRAQTVFLLGYFFAGLWKLRSLGLVIWQEKSFAVLSSSLPHHLSFNMIQKGLDNPLSELILSAPSFVHGLLWLGVVLFELTSLWIIFKPSYHRIWGIMLVFFHTTTSLIMNIHFIEAQLLAVILLVCTPFPQSSYSWTVIKSRALVFFRRD